MKSWKTSLAGLGTILTVASHVVNAIVNGTPIDVTVVLTGLSTGFGLLFARDNNVTSEQVGAKPVTESSPMKKSLLLFLVGLIGVTAIGCHSIELKLPGGAGGKVKSFGRKSSLQSLSLGTNGTLTVEGYNNDEVTGLGMALGTVERLVIPAKTIAPVP